MSEENAREVLERLTAQIGDARRGLPEDVFMFVSGVTPLVNIDLLIRNDEGNTLLTWRPAGLCPAGWHVPGGIVRFKERFADRLAAVARGELGTTVEWKPAPIAINEVIHPSRMARGHFVSLLYSCTLSGPLDERLRYTGGPPAAGVWAWHQECPADLMAVHDMYRSFIGRT